MCECTSHLQLFFFCVCAELHQEFNVVMLKYICSTMCKRLGISETQGRKLGWRWGRGWLLDTLLCLLDNYPEMSRKNSCMKCRLWCQGLIHTEIKGEKFLNMQLPKKLESLFRSCTAEWPWAVCVCVQLTSWWRNFDWMFTSRCCWCWWISSPPPLTQAPLLTRQTCPLPPGLLVERPVHHSTSMVLSSSQRSCCTLILLKLTAGLSFSMWAYFLHVFCSSVAKTVTTKLLCFV